MKQGEAALDASRRNHGVDRPARADAERSQDARVFGRSYGDILAAKADHRQGGQQFPGLVEVLVAGEALQNFSKYQVAYGKWLGPQQGIKPFALRRRGAAGIPDDMMDGDTIAGWEVPLAQHFVNPGDTLGYEYDFGDGWYQSVELVSVGPREPKQKYPRCVDGARACPPEDCGGVPGYYALLDTLADASDEQHDDMIDWLQNHAKNYYP